MIAFLEADDKATNTYKVRNSRFRISSISKFPSNLLFLLFHDQRTVLIIDSIIRHMATFLRMQLLQLKNSGSMCSQILLLDTEIEAIHLQT